MLEKSPSLISIHFLGRYFKHDFWNISNELLFQIIKDSNVYINFGRVKIGSPSLFGRGCLPEFAYAANLVEWALQGG